MWKHEYIWYRWLKGDNKLRFFWCDVSLKSPVVEPAFQPDDNKSAGFVMDPLGVIPFDFIVIVYVWWSSGEKH